MSKQLKSATNEINLMKWLHGLRNLFQLIILAAIFYRALRLSIAFQFAFLNDELRQIFQVFSGSVLKSVIGTFPCHVVYKFEFTTIPLCNTFVKNCIFEKSLIKSSFITAFIAETTRHIEISCLGTYIVTLLYCDKLESNFEEI
ncbi:hypothetical protein T05_6329 [Trichinella murrelli]|uniref:Uncharacterized protein n=1 Tax=Trichinella murrelli TaxID=144512 RepID=A0A0V0TLS7_9BILA|nr:hypothetical protein T05_6329 [Trichinella murrelli]